MTEKKNDLPKSILSAASVEQLEAELALRRTNPQSENEDEEPLLTLNDYVAFEVEHVHDFKTWARIQQSKTCEHTLPELLSFDEWLELYSGGKWMEELFGVPDEEDAKPAPPTAS